MQEIIFGVLGGLALFIYGMNLMSEGLKKVAGDRRPLHEHHGTGDDYGRGEDRLLRSGTAGSGKDFSLHC